MILFSFGGRTETRTLVLRLWRPASFPLNDSPVVAPVALESTYAAFQTAANPSQLQSQSGLTKSK